MKSSWFFIFSSNVTSCVELPGVHTVSAQILRFFMPVDVRLFE